MDLKKLKRLIFDKSKKIGDREFFTSRLLASSFEDKAAAITRRYRSARRIRVRLLWEPKSRTTAYTDNSSVVINCANDLFKDAAREPRYKLVLGFFAHELGHVLYTDFNAEMSFQSFMGKGRWYPRIPAVETAEELNAISEIEEVLKGDLKAVLLRQFHKVNNILEDGYIEDRMLSMYPGTLGHGLNFVRSRHKESMPSVSEMIQKEESEGSHVFLTLEQMMLEYVKFGTINYGNTERMDERIQTMYSLLPLLDEYLGEPNGKNRIDVANRVMIFLWKYVKSYLEFLKKKKEESDSSGSGSGSGSSGKSLEDIDSELSEENLSGTSKEGKSSASPIAGEDEKEDETKSSSPSAEARRKTAKEAKESKVEKKSESGKKGKSKTGKKSKKDKDSSESKESGEEEKSGKEGKSGKDEKSGEESKTSGSKSSEKEEGSGSGSESAETDSSDGEGESESKGSEGSDTGSGNSDETGESSGSEDSENTGGSSDEGDSEGSASEEAGVGSRSDSEKDDAPEDGDHDAGKGESFEEAEGEGEEEYDSEYEEDFDEKAASEISSLLEKMAENDVYEALEKESEAELNRFSSDIDYGPMHRGINIKVHREAIVDDDKIAAYKECAAPLLAISKKLQKSVLQKIKDVQRGGKMTGLTMGRRIESRNLFRNDGKIFYKYNLPQDIPRLAIGILVDESGSMSCNSRDVSARAAAIILYDFCHALGIPVCVYGHSTEYPTGFYGKEDVAIYSYAEFDSVDKKDAYRLMSIHARYNNRDAVPLRFVAERLRKRPEEEKILILISDGQPAAHGYCGTKPCEELAFIKKEYDHKHIGFVAAAIGDDKEQIEKIYGDAFLDITDLNSLPIKLTNIIKKHIRV